MASSNITYVTKQLTMNGKTPRFPSLPLVIPNDTEYNSHTNELKRIQGVKRDKFIVIDEAIQLLKSINKPVGVLSIAGPYRSGKSYVLSRLLGKSNVFDLGHTMDAKTLGIWMGTSVLECDSHVIVLLDTEGIDACTASDQEDTRIFVLTLLLSSYFIYNSRGVVEKSDLDKMNYFVKLAKSVAIKKGSEDKDFNPNELRKYFPDFLWLLRDVTLQSTDENGREITPTEFLLKRVLAADDSKFYESTRDQVGRAILTFFPSVNCVTLPPLSVDTNVMRNIEESIDKLNPNFNKEIDDLTIFLKGKVSTKKVFQTGESVHGRLLAYLIQEFVKEVNDPNNTPVLANTWDSTIKLLINEVTDRLLKEYTVEFTKIYEEDNAGGPLEEGDSSGEGQTSTTTIFGIHHSLMLDKTKKLIEEVGRFCVTAASSNELTQEKLLASFKEKIVEIRMETIRDHNGKLTKQAVVVGGILFDFTQENFKCSYNHCCKIFEKIYKPIKDKIIFPDGTYNFNNLQEDLGNLHYKYFLQSIGPAKWDVYDEKKKVIEIDQAIFQRLAGYEEKILEINKRLAEAERQNQQLSEAINQLRQNLEDENNQNKTIIKQLQKENEEVIARLNEQMEKDRSVEQLKYKEFIKTERQRSAESAAKHAQNQQQIYENMMKMMIDQSKQQLNKMAEVIDKPPPPPPQRKRCCIQ